MAEYKSSNAPEASKRMPNGRWEWEDRIFNMKRNAKRLADDRLANTVAGQTAQAEGWGFFYWQFLFDAAFVSEQVSAGCNEIADCFQSIPDLRGAIACARQGLNIHADKKWVDRQRAAAVIRREQQTSGNLKEYLIG